jgi:F0F1-type ATP synthase delta subunit
MLRGERVTLDGKVYDGSLRSELDKLRHHMATGS